VKSENDEEKIPSREGTDQSAISGLIRGVSGGATSSDTRTHPSLIEPDFVLPISHFPSREGNFLAKIYLRSNINNLVTFAYSLKYATKHKPHINPTKIRLRQVRSGRTQ